MALEIWAGGGVWRSRKSGKKRGSKLLAIRRGGVDFFWNNPIRETAQDEELASIRDIWEQVGGEWSNFERDVKDEIKYLEQAVLESGSVSSRGSKKSKMAKSINSSVDTALSTKVDKYKLQQEEAALKVKLAFVEQEKALKMEKLVQEQKLEELKLKVELELSRAKVSVCKEIEKEQIPSLEEDDLASLPSESKGDGVKRFLQSLPVSTSTRQLSLKYL